MKHSLIILISLLLLSSPVIGQSIVTKEVEETCFVIIDGSKEFNLNLFSQISKSLISQYFKPVKNLPPGGISSDSCVYEITVTKEGDTTFVVFSGEDLNSYGDSKLSGADGFQQSFLKSIYRALEDKRTLICEDYGEFLSKECRSMKKEMIVGKSPQKVLYRSRKGEWTIKKNKNSDRVYKGQIKNGLPHGKGETIVWKNRLKLIGEFKRGKPWNIKKYNKKGKNIGVWIKGKRKIQSKLEEISDSTVLYRSRKGGWIINEEENTDRKYVGEIMNGRPNGLGTLTRNDGKTYVGEWKNGKPWNGNGYDRNGYLKVKYLNGKKLRP